MTMTKKNKNTVYTKKSDLDQFYTSRQVAAFCYDKIWEKYHKEDFSIFLEPSAGDGAFFNLFPLSKRVGLDLSPKSDDIQMMDFFDYVHPEGKKTITIGNPPFGKMAGLAIKFFNRAAVFSDVIAFIIPKTFRKDSVQNKLDLHFRLKLDIDLPKHSFVLDGEPYDVPCCFQVWERSKRARTIRVVDVVNKVFDFVKPEEATFAVRRVGGRAGKASLHNKHLCNTTHYFLRYKASNPILSDFIDMINAIDFKKVVSATAGVRSLSKPELVATLRKQLPEVFSDVH